MRGLAFQTGITALLLATAGLLALVALFPTLPLSTCTVAAASGGPAAWPSFYAIEGTALIYTPDGVNECATHAAVPGVPIALLLLGGLLVAFSISQRG
jgi:hypothetical protein